MYESEIYFPKELKNTPMYACLHAMHTHVHTSRQLLRPKFCLFFPPANWQWLCDKSQTLTGISGYHASSWTSPWEKEELNETFECWDYFPYASEQAEQGGWKKVEIDSNRLNDCILRGYSLWLDNTCIISTPKLESESVRNKKCLQLNVLV